MAHPRPSTALLGELRKLVGSAHVLTGADGVAGYSIDWTGRFGAPASAVVRPADTAEVAAVVRACAAAGVPVVPQGGNTGLVGGGVPRGGEVVLSTARLDRIGRVDGVAGQLTAGAGVTLAAVQGAARRAGWRYPVDFGARESATVGGMVATNAGGAHVVRHGSTRRRVVGTEVVWGDGTVTRRLSGLEKDNAGLDPGILACGSEGTLGVVCAARLRLVPAPPLTVTAWVTFGGLGQAVAAVEPLRRAIGGLEALEFVAPECLGDADGPAALLVEAAGPGDPAAEMAAAVEELDGVTGTEVATTAGARSSLWARRDRLPEVVAEAGVPLKLDVAVPPGELGGFLTGLAPLVAAADPEAAVWRFGHAADGNVHVNVTGATEARAVEEAVLGRVLELGGTPAAEHGIGVAKVPWLGRARGEEEVALVGRLKSALDPAGIMNPGVWGLGGGPAQATH